MERTMTNKNEEKAKINTNDVLVFKCIMALNKCDLESAIWFVKHNQTCYEIARAVANAKDEDAKAEKQALIDKACEWLKDNYPYYFETDIEQEFKQAMKGGEK